MIKQKSKYSFTKLLTFYIYIQIVCSQNCLNAGEIYDFISQKCLKCDDHCNTCSGLTQNDCLTCMNNYYRQGVDNSCQEKCGLGMYINQKTNTCDICSVLGCDQCLQNQRCIKCTESLKLDQQSGCLLNDDTCDQQQYYSLFLKQCSYQCNKNEIKDLNTKLCEPIQNCNYFQERQKKDFFQQISVQTFIDNGFLLIGESICQFYLYNQNLETIYSNLLVQNPLDKTVFYGSSNFYDRNVGGCQTKQKLIGFNFLTYQIEFDISNEFNTFYSLYQLDVENHILVLQKNQGGFTFLDYLNNEQILIETSNLYIYKYMSINSSQQIYLYESYNNENVNFQFKILQLIFFVFNLKESQSAVLYFRKENKIINLDKQYYHIQVLNFQNMIFFATDSKTQGYFFQFDQASLSTKILLEINIDYAYLNFFNEDLQLFYISGIQNSIIYYIQKDNILPIYKIINDIRSISFTLTFYQSQNTNQTSIIVALTNLIAIDQLNYQKYKQSSLSTIMKYNLDLDQDLQSISLIIMKNQVLYILNNYNNILFYIQFEINDQNLEMKKILTSSKQSQEIILQNDSIIQLQISDSNTCILVD
ncbi:furin-like repeat protein (macronuclear) [Tetrahymena thermophila SB210]|uniref:Furin-like repeat protein n=1 Tax=Tetrahymena thermophila (strain SB210) TaxID=312017 RepID=Q23A26_TETTS|nr:furin-like repeat protein [Tetrahymena thermophila SB210]EAR93337.2 furin-like repeat protein [Tetrahymena thermophila SB210]|eukprot:XP_001013582.2 furin-like repeat protein [Tetrahymena thermophila SB210]